MTALRKTGAQLHLFIKIQEEQSFVREFSLLEMRLFHCLIQAWKSSFPTFSEEAVDPKPTWGGRGMDGFQPDGTNSPPQPLWKEHGEATSRQPKEMCAKS